MAKTKKIYKKLRNILIYSAAFTSIAFVSSNVLSFMGKDKGYTSSAPIVNKAFADVSHGGDGDAPDAGDADGDSCDGSADADACDGV